MKGFLRPSTSKFGSYLPCQYRPVSQLQLKALEFSILWFPDGPKQIRHWDARNFQSCILTRIQISIIINSNILAESHFLMPQKTQRRATTLLAKVSVQRTITSRWANNHQCLVIRVYIFQTSTMYLRSKYAKEPVSGLHSLVPISHQVAQPKSTLKRILGSTRTQPQPHF